MFYLYMFPFCLPKESAHFLNKQNYFLSFLADNVVKSVYVGDKVQVKGKVTRKNGESAYITDKGLYLTTDIQYLNDYTTEADSLENEK